MKGIVFLSLAVLTALLLFGCTQSGGESATGRAVVAIADAGSDLNDVSSVVITVTNAEVHSDANGWIQLIDLSPSPVADSRPFPPQTFDLVELKESGLAQILADASLPEGSYQQIRLTISDVAVTDSNGTHSAKLPSGVLKFAGGFSVDANSVSTAVFDFQLDESLHLTGSGQYIFSPVIQLETREGAQVEIEGDNVRISGGSVKDDKKVEMDENGEISE
ncbi:MAG: DUF4382 domain-containing protein [Candidatus Diapherotrites archaeon]